MSNSNGNSWLESSFDKFCQNSTSVSNCIFGKLSLIFLISSHCVYFKYFKADVLYNRFG